MTLRSVVAALVVWGTVVGAAIADVARIERLKAQFNALYAAGDLQRAEPLARQILEAALRDHPGYAELAARSMNDLGVVCSNVGKLEESIELHGKALALRRRQFGDEHSSVAESYGNLGSAYHEQGDYDRAIEAHLRALEVTRRILGDAHQAVGIHLNNLAESYREAGLFGEAERRHREAKAVWSNASGADHPNVATSLNNLALTAHDQGKLENVRDYYLEALAIYERARPANDLGIANTLSNLAALYVELAEHDRAIELLRKALALFESRLGADHIKAANAIHNLGGIYSSLGRFAEAENCFRKSLRITTAVLGEDHVRVATTLSELSVVLDKQRRSDEALAYSRKGLDILERRLGPDHPDVAQAADVLACIYCHLGDYDQSIALHRRALDSRRQSLGEDHPDVAQSLNNIGFTLLESSGDFAAAREYYRQALVVYREFYGDEHPSVAHQLHNLASLDIDEGRLDGALPLLEEAAAIQETTGGSAGDLYYSYSQMARIYRERKQNDRAVDALSHALDLADIHRGRAGGSEADVARSFESFARGFERLMIWQIEAGDFAAAFQTAERGRARVLLDRMEAAGADPLAGVPEREADILRSREAEAKTLVASLEAQLAAPEVRADLDEQGLRHLEAELNQRLTEARLAEIDAYRDIRNASVARNLGTAERRQPISWKTATAWARDEGTLLMQYQIGDLGGYVFVAFPDGVAEVFPLQIDESLAEQVGCEAGPITAQVLGDLFRFDDGDLIGEVACATPTPRSLRRLNELWQVLVPPQCRRWLTEGKLRRLAVIPDGELTLLPFETLVVESGADPRFLLDVGPPVVYGPSTGVLYNLAKRGRSEQASQRKPVLTVADPVYASAGRSSADELSPRARYAGRRAGLAALPHSALESDWVRDVFTDAGRAVSVLTRDIANEANVRLNIAERRIVHLACHGLSDRKFGNYFGGLALTVVDAADPSNDGFLTLSEVCDLDLRSCELAILSACETNAGPQWRGEGVWALSRGFLIAGARRVVASNWLVDDEAAASGISYFCGIVAANKDGREPDYAAALHDAKRWLRRQEKWKSPYYWGTFVLVGPASAATQASP